MKRGCVRELREEGGVCETQRQRNTGTQCPQRSAPQTQPRVPPLLEPPDMLSPSPFVWWRGGGVEKSSGHRRKGGKRKAGVSWSVYGLDPTPFPAN